MGRFTSNVDMLMKVSLVSIVGSIGVDLGRARKRAMERWPIGRPW